MICDHLTAGLLEAGNARLGGLHGASKGPLHGEVELVVLCMRQTRDVRSEVSENVLEVPENRRYSASGNACSVGTTSCSGGRRQINPYFVTVPHEVAVGVLGAIPCGLSNRSGSCADSHCRVGVRAREPGSNVVPGAESSSTLLWICNKPVFDAVQTVALGNSKRGELIQFAIPRVLLGYVHEHRGPD